MTHDPSFGIESHSTNDIPSFITILGIYSAKIGIFNFHQNQWNILTVKQDYKFFPNPI